MEKIQAAFQYIIPVFIFFTVAYGFAKKTPVYESFVSGAKEGIDIIIGIFPYVLAIFIMVKTFQASGAHDFFKGIFATVAGPFGLPAGSLFHRPGQTHVQRRGPGHFYGNSQNPRPGLPDQHHCRGDHGQR